MSPSRKPSRAVVADDLKRLDDVVSSLAKSAKDGDARAIDQLIKIAKERAKLARQVPTSTEKGEAKPAKLLTLKQQLFVEAYTGEAKSNATQACRLAGYQGSDDVLRHRGHVLRHTPHVAAAIAAKLAGDPLVCGGDELRRLWSKIARGETFKQRGAFDVEIEGPPTIKEMLVAASYLGKAHGLFVQKVEVDLPGAEVVITLPDNGRGDRS